GNGRMMLVGGFVWVSGVRLCCSTWVSLFAQLVGRSRACDGGAFAQPSAAGQSFVVALVGASRSARCWQRLDAFERLEDRAGPGPVGGEVKGVAAGVVGELAGDVQDPVAKPFGLAGAVFAVEREQLRPDGDVVRGERELEPRRVRLEGVEREVGGAGR